MAAQPDSGLCAFLERQLDRAVPADTRKRGFEAISELAQTHPTLSAFILTQALFCFLPLALFAAFVLSAVAFSLGAALVFALFWISVGFLALVPALLVTASVGLMVFLWGATSFVVGRWVYEQLAGGGLSRIRETGPWLISPAMKGVVKDEGDRPMVSLTN